MDKDIAAVAEALAREIGRQCMAQPGLEPFDPSLEFDAHRLALAAIAAMTARQGDSVPAA